MTTQSPVECAEPDAYDIGILLMRMWANLCAETKNIDSAYKIAEKATVQELLVARTEWMNEKGPKFDTRYRELRGILEKAHDNVEKLVKMPIIRDSKAYQEWMELKSIAYLVK